MMDFEWLPTECAHERYPMQLISGLLYRDEDEIVRVPAGKIINNGWGEIGSRRLVGTPRKPVPQRLELEWFSFAEDKFFAGSVQLPEAELAEAFRAGFREPLTGNSVSWVKIIVGMGLGGHTSIWLAGSGLVRELLRTQVPEAQLAWSKVLDNPDITRPNYVRAKLRSRLSDAALQSLAKHGPAVASWPRFAQPYKWRIVVEGIQVPLHMFMRRFNGERLFFDFARQPPGELDIAPKQLQITWLARGGGRLLTEIALDEQEIYDIFDRMKAAAPEGVITLRVDFATRSQISLTIEGPDARVPLRRAGVELLALAG